MSVGIKKRFPWADLMALLVAGAIYVVPLIFIFLIAAKPAAEAGLFGFSWPSEFVLLNNLHDVLVYRDNRLLLALWNSAFITFCSVAFIVIFGALVSVILQRRGDKVAAVVNALMIAGLIIPPAVVPTVFLLQSIGLYKTLLGMILVNVALNIPFAVLILRAFMGTVPRELDEATIMDGASPLRMFFSVHLPLLQPAIATVTVTSTVAIFNDFVGPLYFLPGTQNVTAPLTLFTFVSQFGSQWNLVFANVLVITVLPLIVFVFFQRQLVSGITSGAIKG